LNLSLQIGSLNSAVKVDPLWPATKGIHQKFFLIFFKYSIFQETRHKEKSKNLIYENQQNCANYLELWREGVSSIVEFPHEINLAKNPQLWECGGWVGCGHALTKTSTHLRRKIYKVSRWDRLSYGETY